MIKAVAGRVAAVLLGHGCRKLVNLSSSQHTALQKHRVLWRNVQGALLPTRRFGGQLLGDEFFYFLPNLGASEL